MELTTVPRRQPGSSRARAALVLVVLAPVTLLVLVPAAFGLERYVLTADDMGPALGRGTVVVERSVPVGDVREGDVVTFARTGPVGPGGSSPRPTLVTQRVVEVEGGVLTTRADRAAPGDTTTLAGRATVSRVVVALPLVGYPFLGGLGRPVGAVLVLVLGLVLGLLVLCAARRPTRRRSEPEGQVPAGSTP